MNTPSSRDPTPGRDREQPMPRWVKGFVIAAAAAVVLVVVVLMLGSGDHGPQRHQPPGSEQPAQTPEGHTPPANDG